jgi:hypothetical protein
MSRFNTPARNKTLTTNLAGGEAYCQTPELELVSILLTSFVQDQFYRSGSDTQAKIVALVDQIARTPEGAEFCMKAACYARNEFGMRTVSHIVAGELASKLGGSLMKYFLDAVVKRPDDITEITSYYLSKKEGNKVTNAMRKGLGLALSRFNSYQLAKYRGEKKSVSLVDCVNLFHPKHTPALQALVKGTLKSSETWETKLTQAGQIAQDEGHKEQLKARAWAELLRENKLGYMALLRNLRNILSQADGEEIALAARQLVNERAIKKSMVLPFRFNTALEELSKIPGSNIMIDAVHKACDIAVDNCPELPGKTLIAVDVSGSMEGKPIDIASIFAATLYKANKDSEIILFSNDAEYFSVTRHMSVLSLSEAIKSKAAWGGTNFHAIFNRLNMAFDRIIILSDMQGWVGHYSPKQDYAVYCSRKNCHPYVYSFDLEGYGSLQFPERNIFCLAGWSEKIFDVMELLEQDRNALITSIRDYNFLNQ